jgi:signal transduction histidine kinase
VAGVAARVVAHLADRCRTRDTGGSRLGLAICYQLVDAVGGSVITLESTVGVGATFTVCLPAWG